MRLTLLATLISILCLPGSCKPRLLASDNTNSTLLGGVSPSRPEDGVTFLTNILRGFNTVRATNPTAKLRYAFSRPGPSANPSHYPWQTDIVKEQDLIHISLFFEINQTFFRLQSDPLSWGTWLHLEPSAETLRLPEFPFDPVIIKIPLAEAVRVFDRIDKWVRVLRVSMSVVPAAKRTDPSKGSALVWGIRDYDRWTYIDATTGQNIKVKSGANIVS